MSIPYPGQLFATMYSLLQERRDDMRMPLLFGDLPRRSTVLPNPSPFPLLIPELGFVHMENRDISHTIIGIYRHHLPHLSTESASASRPPKLDSIPLLALPSR